MNGLLIFIQSNYLLRIHQLPMFLCLQVTHYKVLCEFIYLSSTLILHHDLHLACLKGVFGQIFHHL